MKYLWIGAIILIIGLRFWLSDLRHREREDYQHYLESRQRESEKFLKENEEYLKRYEHPVTVGEPVTEEDKPLFTTPVSTFYKGLAERHYLQYTNPADTSTIRQAFINAPESDEVLTLAYAEDHTLLPDGRYYPCNGGIVYMENGYLKLIEQLSPTFKKMNFKCQASNQQRIWNPEHKWTNETIIINGKTYTTLKDFTGLGYKEAPARFAEIINEELERQGFNERIYLVSSSKKGKLAILTPELYQYIQERSINDFHSPQTVADWRDLQKL